jgi:monofunctional biosynthetic peptidoglycan transglycosylase
MKRVLLGAAAVCAAVLLILAGWVIVALSNLPDVSVLKRYRPAVASEVLDRNGAVMAQFYDRAFRVWAPISTLPDRVIHAVVTAEDDTFFGHQGINYKAVWDAFRTDLQKKRFARGGSTITQQMIKNVLLSKEKTITRKVREFVLARRAEDILTKRRILEIYLNEVEWGEGVYGIEAASRYYFDKHATELTDAEAALLAGMLPNPRYYDPFKRPDKARQRQEQVLFNMQQAKLLTPEEYEQALAEPLRLRETSSHRFESPVREGGSRPCHLEVLEDILLRFYGDTALYRQGLMIRTTLDRSLQDSLAVLDSSGTGTTGEEPERVLVVKEGGEVRALTCTTNEEQVRSFLSPFPLPGQTYDITVLPPSEIEKKDILLPEPGANEGTKGDKERTEDGK